MTCRPSRCSPNRFASPQDNTLRSAIEKIFFRSAKKEEEKKVRLRE